MNTFTSLAGKQDDREDRVLGKPACMWATRIHENQADLTHCLIGLKQLVASPFALVNVAAAK
jgi:hypothetical protein